MLVLVNGPSVGHLRKCLLSQWIVIQAEAQTHMSPWPILMVVPCNSSLNDTPDKKQTETESTNRRLVSPCHRGPPVFRGEGPDWSLEALLIQVSSESDKYQRDRLSQGLQSAAAQQGFAGPISCSNRSPNSLMCHLLQSHAPNWLEFFFPVAEAIWDGLMSSELWGFSFH